ncbi:MAG: cytidine deaminase [Bacteroidales bacterium]|nr:cytidine deaminase [Bacteroidales bacterium]HOI31842.1 cytidine deaminase [Bacteroidales bacterium]
MRKEIVPLHVLILDSASELASDDKHLLEQARKAAENAYAPYSRFQVGAAVRLANGEIISGNNQENAAYPSGLCAERITLFYAHSRFPDVAVEAIAITAKGNKGIIDEPLSPCGACRQVMAESEKNSNQSMRVIMQGQKGPVMIAESMKVLLPFSFLDDYLHRYTITDR